MILNFQTIQHLNLSHNWIGMQGLEHLKDHFKSFQCLRVLMLSSNKLFLMDDRRTECLRDMLIDVSGTLEELYLAENSMEPEDFECLIPAWIRMPRLKLLNLNVNRVWGPSLRKFLDLYL